MSLKADSKALQRVKRHLSGAMEELAQLGRDELLCEVAEIAVKVDLAQEVVDLVVAAQQPKAGAN